MLEQKAKKTISLHKMLSKGDKIIVAVSGGPDSMALLRYLSSQKKKKIFAAHLNHMLRGRDSFYDEAFVKNEAKRLKINCFVSRKNIRRLAKRSKISVEEAGRNARYEFLEKTAKKVNAGKIAMAHNSDDNIETFIMRLMRGTGIKGTCGIPAVRGDIIRPFIDISKAQIFKYCLQNKIDFRIDKTNLKSDYQRNKIRNKIIPSIQKLDPKIKSKIISFIRSMNKKYGSISERVSKSFGKIVKADNNGALSVLKMDLSRFPASIRGEVIRSIIGKLKGDLNNIHSSHIKSILELKKGMLYLPGGIFAYSDDKSIKISKNKTKVVKVRDFKYRLKVPGRVFIKEAGVKIKTAFVKKTPPFSTIKKNEAYIDASKIKGGLVVRNLKKGDHFIPLGMKGTKKLQDFFVDKKVPVSQRGKTPIVADREKIVWVAGFRINEKVKVTEDSSIVLGIEIKIGK